MNLDKNHIEDIKISSICENNYKYFLNKKNVVGVALGYKITKGFSTFDKCISVFVSKKLLKDKLLNKDIIPKCFKGFKTDIIECGIPKFNTLTSKIRPVLNGYSVGNVLPDGFEGSCGCLVEDKYLYILSCNHVFTSYNEAPIETPILQPSRMDGGKIETDVIGHLKRFIPIKFKDEKTIPYNQVDCALCKVISRSFVSSKIAFVGVPKGNAIPKLNEDVKKVGSISELTTGKVTGLNATFEVFSPKLSKSAIFTNQIVTNKMAYPGDSGSLLLNNFNYALGLNMGGTSQINLFNYITVVLNFLKVKLVTK